MLKEAIYEEALNLFELREQVIEFLVIILLDALHFLAHRAQLSDLIFDLVLKLCDFALEVLN